MRRPGSRMNIRIVHALGPALDGALHSLGTPDIPGTAHPMTPTDASLDELRQQIDRIDDQLHDLLMMRAALVDQIRHRKGQSGTAVVQPAREAAILRRLAARHRGVFPFGAVARIWREIISTFAHLQQPIGIAVYAPETEPGPWDLARDHFGAQIPMAAHRSTGQVIRAVTDRSAAIGVLPMPRENDEDPWWRQLLSNDPAAPRVIVRLPFAGRGNARATGDALAIARDVGDLAGFDRALLAIEFPSDTSRTRLVAALAAAGLAGSVLAVDGSDGISLALAEVAGPVPAQDPRLKALAQQLGAAGVHHLGGYAAALPA